MKHVLIKQYTKCGVSLLTLLQKLKIYLNFGEDATEFK